ncbi:MAG TPA: putative PEP-binding protein, partial [bacterium]|nr:putative PEP-binding protein [bacterium]
RLVGIADETGKPFSICGEMAGDPSLTGLLVGLGITRLSMAPQWILPVGLMLVSIDSTRWSEIADRACAAPTGDRVRAVLRDFQES